MDKLEKILGIALTPTLAVRIRRLVRIISAVIDAITKQLRMDAVTVRLTSEVSASVLRILNGSYLKAAERERDIVALNN